MSLFPIFLKLAARPCVVVGAGNIAESKIADDAGDVAGGRERADAQRPVGIRKARSA